MPLVLAAIDLKLSPSREEIKSRQKRLDSLSLIFRRSELLYDVTDCVAVGTNHILQLALATTKHLFLQRGGCDKLPNMKLANELSSSDRFSRLISGSAESGQPKSWRDAFIRCPRAYLLISTTVDYSLSFGRLPLAHDLPEFVRNIPAMGRIAGLPWTLELFPSLGDNHSAHQTNTFDHSPNFCFISAGKRFTADFFSADNDPRVMQWQGSESLHCISLPDIVSPQCSHQLREHKVAQFAQHNSPRMNLDYMEFEDFSKFSPDAAKSNDSYDGDTVL
jgi:hypothetical protein